MYVARVHESGMVRNGGGKGGGGEYPSLFVNSGEN
jgi:hypothetical protein